MFRLHDYLDLHAAEHGALDFAVEGERRLSYAEARTAVDRLANALIGEGLEVGDRVAILAKNSIEYALFFYACSKAGVAPVPLNYRLAPPEWEFIINDAETKLLVAQAELADALAPVRDGLSTVERFLALGGDSAGWDPFAEFAASGSAEGPARDIGIDDDVYQMYTSGTTGRPKGAVIQQSALAAQLGQLAVGFSSAPGERTLVVAPMYHAAGAMTSFVTVQNGGTLFVQEDFVPAEVVRSLSEDEIRMTTLVPAMIQFCLVAVPDVAERRYDSLEKVLYGASPIAEQTLRRAMEVFGCDFIQVYGMTELTAAATSLSAADHRKAVEGRPELLLSAGRAVLGTEIRIVDGDDRPVPNGTIGEVAVNGPQKMRGYWNRPDASEEALRGGFMHTGDAGIMDEEGYVFIQDRVKDMIVSGGENVYPREVEDALFEHPAVADAAVIGIPDEKWGETVLAFLVLKDGAEATEGDVLDFCRGRLAGYKQPRRVEFIDALPRNPSGKVLKKDLREPFWEGHGRRVS